MGRKEEGTLASVVDRLAKWTYYKWSLQLHNVLTQTVSAYRQGIYRGTLEKTFRLPKNVFAPPVIYTPYIIKQAMSNR